MYIAFRDILIGKIAIPHYLANISGIFCWVLDVRNPSVIRDCKSVVSSCVFDSGSALRFTVLIERV